MAYDKKEAIRLRAEGMTYSAIGQRLGCSLACAYVMSSGKKYMSSGKKYAPTPLTEEQRKRKNSRRVSQVMFEQGERFSRGVCVICEESLAPSHSRYCERHLVGVRASLKRSHLVYSKTPERRLALRMRTRINMEIKKIHPKSHSVDLVGCSWNYLRDHLQSQFTEGMSWDNYGKWHVDHKRAMSKFDLTDLEQAEAACHYTNLQPLWASDNLRKGNR
jgi:hypothetical protein